VSANTLHCAQCAAPFAMPPVRRGGKPRIYCQRVCQIAAANARRKVAGSNLSTSARKPVEQPIHSTPIRTAPCMDRLVSDLPNPPSVASKAPPLTHRNGIAVVGDRVRIWVDSAVLGSGERHLLVTTITKTTVHLYSVAALREITITRSEFEQCAESYGSNARIVLGLLEVNLRAYARSGLEHDRPSAAALDALREMAK
jgi:hypothetical protein